MLSVAIFFVALELGFAKSVLSLNPRIEGIFQQVLESNSPAPLLLSTSTVQPENYCNNNTIYYDFQGNVLIQQTLADCIATFDALTYPGLQYGQTEFINITYFINNLISIEEVSNSVTLDFLVSTLWVDPRLRMPNMWAKLVNQGDEYTQKGIDITDLLSAGEIAVWMPTIVYPEATSFEITTSYARLSQNGKIAILQHVIATFIQPSFNYAAYPDDRQDITIRFFPFALNSQQIQFGGQISTCCGQNYLVSEFEDSFGQQAIEQNPIWTFISTSLTLAPKAAFSTEFQQRSIGFLHIIVQRKANGIVYRLALPMLLLTVIGTASFWADPADRINLTITILLTISALYIVVFQNIPMIGYLTKFDTYVISLFLILFVCAIVHQQTCYLLKEDVYHKWPLRKIYLRGLECSGRVTIIPLLWILYSTMFSSTIQTSALGMGWAMMVIFVISVLQHEYGLFIAAMNEVIHEIEGKMKLCSTVSTDVHIAAAVVSWKEKLVFNIWKYGLCSITLDHHYKVQMLATCGSSSSSDIENKVEFVEILSVQKNPMTANHNYEL